MEILKISVLILIVVVLLNSLPTMSREISLLLTFSCCIVVSLYILNTLMPAVEYIKTLMQNVAFEDIGIIFKAVGIGFITQFVSDIATDSNNKTLANLMIFTGRVFILVLAVPVFLRIFEIIGYLI